MDYSKRIKGIFTLLLAILLIIKIFAVYRKSDLLHSINDILLLIFFIVALITYIKTFILKNNKKK